MMKILSEFKTFALRGNVIDLAVGVIIGAAFTKIVDSLVKDVLMPPIGWLAGGVRFDERTVALAIPGKNPITGTDFTPVEVHYGKFLQTSFEFVVIAFCLFLLIKLINRLQDRKNEAPKATELTTTEKLLMEIRDELKGRNGAAPQSDAASPST